MPIKIIRKNRPQEEYHFNSNSISIGRESDNDIVIDNPIVSKYHARIDKKEKGYYLKDLNSTNGTIFNYRKVSRVHLFDRDTFRIVNEEFIFLEIPHLTKKESGFVSDHSLTGSGKTKRPDLIRFGKLPKAIPWIVATIVFIIAFLLIYLYYPFYDVQTGTLITCKNCGNEITNTVHTVQASLISKDDYKITLGKEYCQICGNEQIPYEVRVHCSNCNQVYERRMKTAPRRLEIRDSDVTEGYCSGTCNVLGETKDFLGEGQELIEDLFRWY